MGAYKHRREGTLASWNDDRGFGFISVPGEQRVFVHISAFPQRAIRPEIGEQLSFETELSPEGKQQARRIHFAGQLTPSSSESRAALRSTSRSTSRSAPPESRNQSSRGSARAANRTSKRPGASSYLAVVAFAALLLFVNAQSPIPLWLLGYYVVASLVTFIAYAVDKSAASAGRWRVAESTLHFLSLFGGWPGAIVAQQTLRHKTQKKSFREMFWVTVFVNVLAFVVFATPILSWLLALIA